MSEVDKMIDGGPWLMEEELAYIRDHRQMNYATKKEERRCPSCGHLHVLHNYHCCVFCQVPYCTCHGSQR